MKMFPPGTRPTPSPPRATASDDLPAAEPEEPPSDELAAEPTPPEPVLVPVFYFWPVFIQSQFDAFNSGSLRSVNFDLGFPIGPFVGPPASPANPPPSAAR